MKERGRQADCSPGVHEKHRSSAGTRKCGLRLFGGCSIIVCVDSFVALPASTGSEPGHGEVSETGIECGNHNNPKADEIALPACRRSTQEGHDGCVSNSCEERADGYCCLGTGHAYIMVHWGLVACTHRFQMTNAEQSGGYSAPATAHTCRTLRRIAGLDSSFESAITSSRSHNGNNLSDELPT